MDFLDLEQKRQETADPRYLIDNHTCAQLIENIRTDINIVLNLNPIDIVINFNDNIKKPGIRDYTFESYKNTDYNQVPLIREIISKEGFWHEDILNVNKVLGEKSKIERELYFKKVLKEYKEKIEFIISAFGSFMFYENFLNIFFLRQHLDDCYLSEEMNLKDVKDQTLVAEAICNLLFDCKLIEMKIEDWDLDPPICINKYKLSDKELLANREIFRNEYKRQYSSELAAERIITDSNQDE